MKFWTEETKQKARDETVVQPYRSHFGTSLPANKQYWTLCAACSDGCELDQVTATALVTPGQFHGVDRDAAIYAHNVKERPEIKFYHDDLYEAIADAAASGTFDPGVINVDLQQTPETSANYVGKIMFLASEFANVLVVANFILERRWLKATSEEAVGELNRSLAFRASIDAGFKLHGLYCYGGASRGRTVMGSFVFYKKTSTRTRTRLAA